MTIRAPDVYAPSFVIIDETHQARSGMAVDATQARTLMNIGMIPTDQPAVTKPCEAPRRKGCTGRIDLRETGIVERDTSRARVTTEAPLILYALTQGSMTFFIRLSQVTCEAPSPAVK